MARIKAANKKPKLQQFTIIEYRLHSYSCSVQARSAMEALQLSCNEIFIDQGLDWIEPSLIIVLDENGENVYEEIP